MSIVPPSGMNMRGAVDLSSLVNRPPVPAPGAPTGPAGAPVQVPSLELGGTDANFGEILELSMTVPVIVDLWAEWCEPCKQLTPVLEKLIGEYAGKFVLAKVDVDSNPQLTQAFQAQSIPTVAAVIGGQPVQLFNGALPEAQVREVLERVLELAAQHGVTGTAVAPDVSAASGDAAAEAPAPVEPELPPLHREAYDAIERGDYAAAISLYKTALAQDPRDQMAVAGLAQVSLLARLHGPGSVRRPLRRPATSTRSSWWPTSTCPAVTSRMPSTGCSRSSPARTPPARTRSASASLNCSRSSARTTRASRRPVPASPRCSTKSRRAPLARARQWPPHDR
jgi:putative thioredoxin